jgi:hypothetical protein
MFYASPGVSPALPLFVAPQQQQQSQQQLQGAQTSSHGPAAGAAHAHHDHDGLFSSAANLGSAGSGQLQAALGAPASIAPTEQQQQHNHAITSAFGFMPGRQLSYPSPLPEYSLLDDQPLQLQGLSDPTGAAAGAGHGGSTAALLGSGPNLAAAGLGLGTAGGNAIDSLLLGGLPGEQDLQESRLSGMVGCCMLQGMKDRVCAVCTGSSKVMDSSSHAYS